MRWYSWRYFCQQDVRELFMFHMAGIAMLTLLVNGTTAIYVVRFFGMAAKPGGLRRATIRLVSRDVAKLIKRLQSVPRMRVDWHTVRKHTKALLSSLIDTTAGGDAIGTNTDDTMGVLTMLETPDDGSSPTTSLKPGRQVHGTFSMPDMRAGLAQKHTTTEQGEAKGVPGDSSAVPLSDLLAPTGNAAAFGKKHSVHQRTRSARVPRVASADSGGFLPARRRRLSEHRITSTQSGGESDGDEVLRICDVADMGGRLSPGAAATAEDMAEARLEFISLLRGEFWAAKSNGHLSQLSMSALLLACDRAEVRVYAPACTCCAAHVDMRRRLCAMALINTPTCH